MTLRQRLEKLTDNAPAKIISLVVAILLYAFYQISSLDTRNLVVPLSVNSSTGAVPVSPIDSSVRVTVRGNTTDVAVLESKDFNAFIDLDYYEQEGTQIIPVQLTLSDNVRVLKNIEILVHPENIELTLEKTVEQYVPVQIKYAGGAAYGYEIGDIKLTPSMIKISGPQSLVEKTEYIETDLTLLEDLTHSETVDLSLVPLNKRITVHADSTVRAEIPVNPIEQQRVLNEVAVNTYYLKQGLEIISSVPSADVVLSGTLLNMEKFTQRPGMLFVDCSSIDGAGSFTLPIRYINPNGLTVTSVEPTDITLTIKDNRYVPEVKLEPEIPEETEVAEAAAEVEDLEPEVETEQ